MHEGGAQGSVLVLLPLYIQCSTSASIGVPLLYYYPGPSILLPTTTRGVSFCYNPGPRASPAAVFRLLRHQ